jgi:hypothetical protein
VDRVIGVTAGELIFTSQKPKPNPKPKRVVEAQNKMV